MRINAKCSGGDVDFLAAGCGGVLRTWVAEALPRSVKLWQKAEHSILC